VGVRVERWVEGVVEVEGEPRARRVVGLDLQVMVRVQGGLGRGFGRGE
jgi:hypothetical protein